MSAKKNLDLSPGVAPARLAALSAAMTVVREQMRQVPGVAQQLGDESYSRHQAQHAAFIREILELTDELSKTKRAFAQGVEPSA